MFRDRAAAGRELAERLAPLVRRPCVVAAIPPGGVAVAAPIAERLNAPLTIVGARELAAPIAPDLGFGAVDEDGQMVVDAGVVAMLGLSREEVERTRAAVAAEISRSMTSYGVVPLAHYLPDAAAVLVAEGLVTGLTLRAALRCARRRGARDLTVAVPCAVGDVAADLRREADRLVTLVVDEEFVDIAEHYEDFAQISEVEAKKMLSHARRRMSAAGESGLRLSFETARGFRLAGDLLLPASPGPHPLVVFSGGPGLAKDSPANQAATEALRAAAIGALLFDFAGQGESEGVPQERSLDQQVADLTAALDVVDRLDDVHPTRLGILGEDTGAAVAVHVAAFGAPMRVRALVLLSANVAGAEDALAAVTVPTLLLVGERDEAARHVSEVAEARLRGPRRLEVIPRADHRFGDPAALRRAVDLTVRWFSEHLGKRETRA